MRESFGAGMRQRRERAQISLGAIAEQTKIKASLLEAMERDDVSQWPSGIFRRAFIRAYAHAIGLDPDVVVREFLDRYPDPIEDIGPALAMAAGVDAASGERRALHPVSIPDRCSHRLPVQSSRRRRAARFDRRRIRRADDRAASARVDRSARDLLAAADLCTELGKVSEVREAAPLLERAAKILDAVGLIVWLGNPQATELTPALAHGYSDKVLAQLPKVKRDDDHATAAAFRSAQTSIVNGSHLTSGALVVPLMTPGACAGVLAIELRHDTVRKRIGARDGHDLRRAAGTIDRNRAAGQDGRSQARVIHPGSSAQPPDTSVRFLTYRAACSRNTRSQPPTAVNADSSSRSSVSMVNGPRRGGWAPFCSSQSGHSSSHKITGPTNRAAVQTVCRPFSRPATNSTTAMTSST